MINQEFAADLRRHATDLVKIARTCNSGTAKQLEAMAIALLANVARQESLSQVVLGESPQQP